MRVGGHRFFDWLNRSQPLTEHPAAADLLLWRRGLAQFQAWSASQLTSRLFNDNTESVSQGTGIGVGQIHCGADVHRFQMRFHLPAHAPDLGHCSIPQHPVAFVQIADIDDPTCLSQETLGCVIRKLSQGFRRSDADPDRYARALEDGSPYATTECCEIPRDAGQVRERFVDTVNLSGGHHGLDDRHHALAHVAIKRVVAAEYLDAVAAQHLFDLEIRSPHFYKWLGVIAAGDDASVIIAEDHDRSLFQVRTEDALAARIKAVAVNQRENRLMPFHDGACCNSPRPK